MATIADFAINIFQMTNILKDKDEGIITVSHFSSICIIGVYTFA